MSATEVHQESQFARCIEQVFREKRPMRIFETGLYHGTGSTSVIAYLIKSIPLTGAKFYSIECNPEFIEIAQNNLRESGLDSFVNIFRGNSIPFSRMPDRSMIFSDILMAQRIGSYVDHLGNEAADLYLHESGHSEHYDIIGHVMKEFYGVPDFILLDSAGHLGWYEFIYLLGLLKSPCVIALDDTNHIKHDRSSYYIRNCNKFKILHEGNEKFGFTIAEFTP